MGLKRENEIALEGIGKSKIESQLWREENESTGEYLQIWGIEHSLGF